MGGILKLRQIYTNIGRDTLTDSNINTRQTRKSLNQTQQRHTYTLSNTDTQSLKQSHTQRHLESHTHTHTHTHTQSHTLTLTHTHTLRAWDSCNMTSGVHIDVSLVLLFSVGLRYFLIFFSMVLMFTL